MKDESKTKAQLIAELKQLQKRVGSLETSGDNQKPASRIQELPEIYRVIVESIPQIIFLKNKKLVYLSCNYNFARALGRTCGEVCGKTDYDLFPKELAEKYRADDRAVLRTGQIIDTEETFVDSSYVHTFKTWVRAEDGEVIGVLGIGYDVTKQKMTEQELKEHRGKLEKLVQSRTVRLKRSKEQFKAEHKERRRTENALKESEVLSSSLLNYSPNPILVTNPDSSINYVNPALEKLAGYTSSELIGHKAPYPWWTDKDGTNKDFQHALRGGTKGMEALFKTKSGEQFWVEINAAVVVGSDGEPKYYLAIWTDTTKQKRLNEDLRFYVDQVTRAQEEERKRIARDLHDETLQALFGLRTDMDKIIREKQRLPGHEEVAQLEHVQDRIQNIMHGVRRFSHELRPDMLDTFGLIPALELLAGEADQEGEMACHLEVIGSERRLTPETELVLFRITQEALHNGKKYSSGREILVRVTFDGERVKLDIIDDGIGFELPAKMSSFTHMGKLGLVGMYERAYSLGGSFSITSEVGKGTEVTVDVPA